MFINEVFTFYSLFSQGSTFMVNISQKIGKIISLNQKNVISISSNREE